MPNAITIALEIHDSPIVFTYGTLLKQQGTFVYPKHFTANIIIVYAYHFENDELYIILKRTNLEICEHSSFSIIDVIVI